LSVIFEYFILTPGTQELLFLGQYLITAPVNKQIVVLLLAMGDIQRHNQIPNNMKLRNNAPRPTYSKNNVPDNQQPTKILVHSSGTYIL
jgi:hypothetical protein